MSAPHEAAPVASPPGRAAASRTRRLLVGTVAVAVAAAAVGWFAGSRIRSPEEVAADAEPPPASNITVPVESRVLSSSVVTRGTVAFEEATAVTVSTGSALAAVITRAPSERGSVVDEGEVIVEVTGRPVFILAGELPMFRDFVPGVEGDDVRQFEEALARLGFQPGAVDGRYDEDTESAVERWYVQAGHEATGPSDDQRERLRLAREAVGTARSQVRSAEQGLSQAGRPASRSTQLSQDEAVRSAEARVRDAENRRNQAVAAAEQGVAEARVGVVAAEAVKRTADERLAQGEQGIDPGPNPNPVAPPGDGPDGEASPLVSSKALAAQTDPTTTTTTTTSTTSTTTTTVAPATTTMPPPTSTTTVVPAGLSPERLAELRGEVEAARLALEAARAGLVAAEAAATTATDQADADLAAERSNLEIARATRTEVLAPGDTSAARELLADANDGLVQANERLAELEAEIGIVVPANEVVFVTTLPRRVDQVLADRGDVVTGPVMTISSADLVVDSAVAAGDRPLLADGVTATVEDPGLGVRLEGTITEVADQPGTEGVPDGRFYVRIELPETDRADEIRGLNLRVTVPVESTGGREVLAVPAAALSATADGGARVQVEDADGTVRNVAVAVGLFGRDQGLFEVTPVGDDRLAAGDRVIVGREGRLDAGDDAPNDESDRSPDDIEGGDG